jgi:hypothetical protein
VNDDGTVLAHVFTDKGSFIQPTLKQGDGPCEWIGRHEYRFLTTKRALTRRALLVKGYRNGTIDFGKFQINSAWEAKAASMGYNIYLPEGNEAYVYLLYDTRGTEDWYSSKHCWSK